VSVNAPSIAPGRKFILWDASAIISYYLRIAAANTLTHDRAFILVDAVRNHRTDIHFFIPNIVVAEVFTAFDRYCYSCWDKQIYKKFGGKGKALHANKYQSIRRKFRADIHNGALFYQCELNRYHILALDLIAPVDKYRQYYRKGRVQSMGASDLLVGAMAIHLSKIHGRERVALVTTDRRMEAIFSKACPKLPITTAKKLGLIQKAKELGFGTWEPSIYPHVIDLARCKDSLLIEWFGTWPLNTRKVRGRESKA
jgi:hypothetical protein